MTMLGSVFILPSLAVMQDGGFPIMSKSTCCSTMDLTLGEAEINNTKLRPKLQKLRGRFIYGDGHAILQKLFVQKLLMNQTMWGLCNADGSVNGSSNFPPGFLVFRKNFSVDESREKFLISVFLPKDMIIDETWFGELPENITSFEYGLILTEQRDQAMIIYSPNFSCGYEELYVALIRGNDIETGSVEGSSAASPKAFPNSGSSDLAPGAIAGIVVGSVLFVGLGVYGLIRYFRRKGTNVDLQSFFCSIQCKVLLCR